MQSVSLPPPYSNHMARISRQQLISYEELDSTRDLTPMAQALWQAARDATANAYAPYSGFRVGAALLTRSGEVVAAPNASKAVA